MKCYMVYVDEVNDNEYDSCVVLADSEEEVRSMFKKEESCNVYTGREESVYFYDYQGEIHIEEMTEKGLVLASFNAG